MLRDLTDPGAVRRAAREFDRLGREAFLERYGFGPARDYFVVIDGKEYDSKAIVGVAFGIQHPRLGPLQAGDFSGGAATVKRTLEKLGYQVVTR